MKCRPKAFYLTSILLVVLLFLMSCANEESMSESESIEFLEKYFVYRDAMSSISGVVRKSGFQGATEVVKSIEFR